MLDNDCLGLELGCNDDTYGLQSEVTVNLEAGQTVVVIVDGYEETGDAMLNVTTDSAGSLPACCTAEAGAGCGDTDIEACVCSADDFCCTEQWDDLCAAAVTDLGCGVCAPSASDTSSSCASPEVLEGELPLLLSGTTVGGSSATGASCGGEAGPETVYTFTAPATGDYVVDTNGSVMDTLLYVLQGDCEGEELACNDDQDDSLQSRVELSLTQGQQVRIVPCEVRVIARPSNGGR